MKTDTIPAETETEFQIGKGVTVCGYSDREAFTVIKRTAKTITIQRDKATLLNGYKSGEPDALKFYPGGFHGHTEGVQRYHYERDENGEILVARLRKQPRRVSLTVGEYTRDETGNLITYKLVPDFKVGSKTVIAGRSEHYDFNF